jgi:hypothetical protein
LLYKIRPVALNCTLKRPWTMAFQLFMSVGILWPLLQTASSRQPHLAEKFLIDRQNCQPPGFCYEMHRRQYYPVSYVKRLVAVHHLSWNRSFKLIAFCSFTWMHRWFPHLKAVPGWYI